MTSLSGGEPTDAELEQAIEIERLTETFRVRLQREPHLTPEAFAAECTTVPQKKLLKVLKAMGVLSRTTQRLEGPFSAGERVGSYVIRQVIGRGGMGVVYEAVEEELGRTVALKAMLTGADARMSQRFAREARAAARLDHPSIVPVFGSGEHRGVLWYAMRRVEGLGLDAMLARLRDGDEKERAATLGQLGAAGSGASSSASWMGQLTELERAATVIAFRVADALSYAHAEGVLHRDIKPGNVLIERDGSTMLTDFGLCKVEGDASLTRDTDIVGTLRYMPPESFSGPSDGRSDVYGVGLLLLEILSGRPAYDVDDRRTLMQSILNRDPEPLRDGSMTISGDLERVLRKAIAKLPEERYATATDLTEDLRAVLEGQPVRARATTSPLYLARLFVRRNRALSLTVAGALAALAMGAGFYIVQLRGANRAITEARDLAEQRAAEASVASAEATLRLGDTSGAATALDAVGEEHRGWMWQHLAQRVGASQGWQRTTRDSPLGFAVSRDGRRGAIFSKTEILLMERTGKSGQGIREIVRLGEGAADARFHPDGSLYWMALSTKKLRRWVPGEESSGGSPEGSTTGIAASLPRRASLLRFSPDGKVALVLDSYKDVVAFGVGTWEERWRRSVPIARADTLEALSATEFVAGSTGGQVVRGGAGEEPIELVAQHFGRIRGLLVEEGELLASGGETGQLDLEIALTGHTRVRVRLESPILGIARVPASSERIAVATDSGWIALVDVRTGAIVRRLGGLRAEPLGLWGGEQPFVSAASMDARMTAYSAADHDGRIELPPALGNLYPPTVSADGRWMAAASNDGVVNFYDLVEGERLAFPLGSLPSGLVPAFHPQGRLAIIGSLLLDLTTAEIAGELPQPVKFSAWLPDGTLIVVDPAGHQGGSGADERAMELARARPLALESWMRDADPGAPSEEALPMESLPAGPHGPVLQLASHGQLSQFYLLHADGSMTGFGGPDLAELWHTDVSDGGRWFTRAEDELFLVGSDGLVHVLDAGTGESLGDRAWRAAQELTRKSSLSSIAAGPEPGLVTTCTVNGRVEVWSTGTGRRVGTISSGVSYLRHVAAFPGAPWMVGAGGFGRLVLIGHGASPMGGDVLQRLYARSGPEERISECAQWLDLSWGPRSQRTAAMTSRALDRTYRYRRSDWTQRQKGRLRTDRELVVGYDVSLDSEEGQAATRAIAQAFGVAGIEHVGAGSAYWTESVPAPQAARARELLRSLIAAQGIRVHVVEPTGEPEPSKSGR